MEILFETYGGKKINKKFESAKNAKEYILRNKAFIKEAQIMEGPLGSGGWTYKKAKNQYNKGKDNYNIFSNQQKDKNGLTKLETLNQIYKNLINSWEAGIWDANTIVGVDKYGYYLYMGDVASKAMKDNDDIIEISPDSEKYGKIIRLPKLSLYVKNNGSLPSEKQIRKYFLDTINKRYDINFKKRPKFSHLSNADVKDF